MNLLDYLTPQANAAAASATQAAIDTATQKPFAVVLSVEQETQLWLTLLAIGVAVLVVYHKSR